LAGSFRIPAQAGIQFDRGAGPRPSPGWRTGSGARNSAAPGTSHWGSNEAGYEARIW